MATVTPNRPEMKIEFKAAPKKPKVPTWVGWLITIAVLAVAGGLFAAASDFATGGVIAGWWLIGAAGVALLGFIVALVVKHGLIGFSAVGFGIAMMLFAGLGLVGILLESTLRLQQGDDLRAASKYEAAIKEYKSVGGDIQTGKLPETYLIWGKQLNSQKQYEAAIKAYQQVSDPAYAPNAYANQTPKLIAESYTNWGLQLENEAKSPEQALARYDAAIKASEFPEAADKARAQARAILFAQGDTQAKNGAFEQAIAIYQKTLDQYGAARSDLQPYLSRTYQAWGKQLLDKGNYEQAIAKLEDGVKNFAGTDANSFYNTITDAYVKLGQQLQSDGKYDDIVKRVKPALDQYGAFDVKGDLQNIVGNAYTEIGKTQEGGGKLREAINSFELGLRYNGSNGSVRADLQTRLVGLYIKLGDSFFGQGNFIASRDTFDEALGKLGTPENRGTLRAKSAKARLALAQQAENSADFPTALARYRAILSDYPDLTDFTSQASEAQPRVILKTAYKAMDEKYYDDAINVFQQLVDRYGLTSYGVQAKNELDREHNVTIQINNSNNGKPLVGIKVLVCFEWDFSGGIFTPKGTQIERTTNNEGKFTVSLKPGKNQAWALAWREGPQWITEKSGDLPAFLVTSYRLRDRDVVYNVNYQG